MPDGGLAIEGPEGLLTWPSSDRALLTFTGRDDIEARADAVQALLRQWIAHVRAGDGPADAPRRRVDAGA